MEKTLILRFFQRYLNLIPPSPLRSVRIVDMYEYSSRCTIQEAFNLSLRVVVTYIYWLLYQGPTAHRTAGRSKRRRLNSQKAVWMTQKIKMALGLEIIITRRRYVIQAPDSYCHPSNVVNISSYTSQSASAVPYSSKKDGHGLLVYSVLKKELCGYTLPYIQFFNYM